MKNEEVILSCAGGYAKKSIVLHLFKYVSGAFQKSPHTLLYDVQSGPFMEAVCFSRSFCLNYPQLTDFFII